MEMSNHKHENSVGNAGDGEAGLVDRPTRLKRAGRFTLKLLLVVGGLFLVMVVGLMLMSAFSLVGMEHFRERMGHADNYMVYVRLLAIGLLIGFWRPFNGWLAKVRRWPEGQLERVLEGRWMALAILLFVEVILVQRVHESLIKMVK
jgi:hypothetical protein